MTFGQISGRSVILMYEMVAGTRPFKGRTAFEVSSAILRSDPPSLPSGCVRGIQGRRVTLSPKGTRKAISNRRRSKSGIEFVRSTTWAGIDSLSGERALRLPSSAALF